MNLTNKNAKVVAIHAIILLISIRHGDSNRLHADLLQMLNLIKFISLDLPKSLSSMIII